MPGPCQVRREREAALVAMTDACCTRFRARRRDAWSYRVAPHRNWAMKFAMRSPRSNMRLAEPPVGGLLGAPPPTVSNHRFGREFRGTRLPPVTGELRWTRVYDAAAENTQDWTCSPENNRRTNPFRESLLRDRASPTGLIRTD